jgi:lysylphosphatidylglycerol synthetase-like protein (DUF2156 family)
MSQGIASLHKILKDDSRQRILLSLNERGYQTYTDLMSNQGFASTGKFNYHLKMLNGLVTKNQDGLYYLTEKGKLAIRLLEEFCEKQDPYQQNGFIPRSVSILAGLFLTLTIVVQFGLYILHFVEIVNLAAIAVLGVGFLVIGERARQRKTLARSENQMLGVKIIAILTGVLAGWVIVFYSKGIFSGLISSWNFDFVWWIVASFSVGTWQH